jgi:hypothetical protein
MNQAKFYLTFDRFAKGLSLRDDAKVSAVYVDPIAQRLTVLVDGIGEETPQGHEPMTFLLDQVLATAEASA